MSSVLFITNIPSWKTISLMKKERVRKETKRGILKILKLQKNSNNVINIIPLDVSA